MKSRVLADALEELEAARFRYHLESRTAEADFSEALALALEAITQSPFLYPKLDSDRRGRGFRCYLLKRFPYVIHYTVDDEEVLVFAVAHTSRRPNYWRNRKG